MKSKTGTAANAETSTKKAKTDDTFTILIGNLSDDILPEKFVISKKETAHDLFDRYCDELVRIYRLGEESEELKNSQVIMKSERNYFGLRYSDYGGRLHWMDANKSVFKQLTEAKSRASSEQDGHQYKITFRMKHYPPQLSDLSSTISHYLFFLQIRRDLIQGRLLCPKPEDMVRVGSLIHQAEEGDAPFSSIDQMQLALASSEDSVLKKKLFLRPSEELNMQVLLAYLELKGKLSKTEAVKTLLDLVTSFPTYGIDPFQVEPLFQVPLNVAESLARGTTGSEMAINTSSDVSSDVTNHLKRSQTLPMPSAKQKAEKQLAHSTSVMAKSSDTKTSPNYYLGIGHSGLHMFVGTNPNMNWTWDEISEMKCNKKVFKIVCKAPENDKKAKTMKYEFRMNCPAVALCVWKWANDRKFFFTLSLGKKPKPVKTTNSFLRRGKSFKFTGSCKAEVQKDVECLPKTEQQEIMYTSMRIVNMNQANLQKLEALGLPKTAKATVSIRPALSMEPSLSESTPKLSDALEMLKEATDGSLEGTSTPRDQADSARQSSLFDVVDQEMQEIEEEKEKKEIFVVPETNLPLKSAPTSNNGKMANGYMGANGFSHQNSSSSSEKVDVAVVKPEGSCGPVVIGLVAFLGVVMAIAVFVLESRTRPGVSANQLQHLAYEIRQLPVVDSFGRAVYDPLREAILGRNGNGFMAPRK